MKIKLITLMAIILSALFLLIPKVALANGTYMSPLGTKVEYESINPDSPFYSLKRLSEKIKSDFLLKNNKEKRAKYFGILLDRRFKELVYIANNEKFDFLENTVSRFNTTAGTVLEQYKELLPNLDTQSGKYPEVLSSLRGKFEQDSAYWLLLGQTLDTSKRL